MITLNDELLDRLGLGQLHREHRRALLTAIYDELEIRVGHELARRMSNAQLDEFEAFIDEDDTAGALKWLGDNFPDYQDVVKSEFEALCAEMADSSSDICALSMLYVDEEVASTF